MSKSPQQRRGRPDSPDWRTVARPQLPVPDSAGLRPTTDRVRETLFNWLAPDIQQARCLDCYAGSGALA